MVLKFLIANQLTRCAGNFKWLSMYGVQAKFTENLRASPFSRDTFIQIYLDGQYLKICATMGVFQPICTITMCCTYNLLPLFEVCISVLLLVVQKPNSCTYKFFEVSGHNLDSSQT